MECKQYQNYELGKISIDTFTQHLDECKQCQESMRADEQLMVSATGLNKQIKSPDLWHDIEQKMISQKKRNHFTFFPAPLYKIAAAILITAGLLFIFNQYTEKDTSRILNATALLEVEQKEQEYIRSINRLEKVAATRTDELDINLALLYRDRLETIDAQIERCQEALEGNPANTHIRRYLLAALNDKKQTLREIIQ